MITAGDEFLVHQTPWPVALPATSDANFYDRYFFNGYPRDGSLYFAAAMGLYPNLGLIDAAFNVLVDGRQRVLRASGLLRDRLASRVGPITVEVLEPLRVLRLTVADNPWGLAADLVFEARAEAFEEPHFFRQNHVGAVVMDYTRYTQHGCWRGWLALDGRRMELRPEFWWGSRDHSWGIRPVGRREVRGAPPADPPQFFWNWAPINFEDLCTLSTVSETADGSRWHESGVFIRPFPQSAAVRCAVDHRITFKKGTRHLERAEIILTPPGGEPERIEVEAIAQFLMRGLGYGDPTWGHGMWVGPEAVDGTELVLAEEQPLAHPHVQTLVRARRAGREGVGVFETLVVGPHARYGFRDLADPA